MAYPSYEYYDPYVYPENKYPWPKRHSVAPKMSQSALRKNLHNLQSLGSWIYGSGHPAPEESAILSLTNPKLKPAAQSASIGRHEAFGLMHQAVKGKITTAACLDSSKRHKYKKEFLPFMVFHDLDKALFRSTLEGNVHLRWSNMALLSTCSRPGPHGRLRITIDLCPILISRDYSREVIIGTLLHQMIHAYLLQVCGYRSEGVDTRGHDLGHDHEFLAAQHTIREHFLPGEGPAVHCLHGSKEKLMSRGTSQRTAHRDAYYSQNAHSSQARQAAAGYSSCYDIRRRVSAADAENWRMTALTFMMAKAASPRSSEISLQPGRTTQSIFQYVDKWFCDLPSPVLIHGSSSNKKYGMITECGLNYKIQSVPRISAAHDTFVELECNSCILQISKDDSRRVENLQRAFGTKIQFVPQARQEFEILGAFLKFGDFAPTKEATLRTLTERQPRFFQIPASRSKLPTIIESYQSPIQFFMMSIRAFKLSVRLKYEPLAVLALTRLRAIPYMVEDPIAILQDIYATGPIDPHLSEWTRSWLSAPLHRSLGSYAAKYPFNISVLKHSDKYQRQFHSLLLKSSKFAQDITAIESSSAYLQSWTVPNLVSHPQSPFAQQANFESLSMPTPHSADS